MAPSNTVAEIANRTAGQTSALTATESSCPSRSRVAAAFKRTLDIFVSLAMMAVLSPLFIVIALVVKLQDGGPVIYRRRVVGSHGEFDAFKFRTMRVDADAFLAEHPELLREFQQDFKLREDPRITRIGAVLRKLSLDELPQLANVLLGQMSIVGPRMITTAELSKYGSFQSLLLTVKPGLTGYWQVHGRQEVSYADRVKMDMDYIQNWSFWLDVSILLKTPGAVFRTRGAF